MNVRARLVFCWLFLQVIFISVLSDVWKAKVVSEIKALVTSCVVVPCTFQYPGIQHSSSQMRGIWHRKNDGKYNVYHEDKTLVSENFKERTRLLGDLGQKNCTLEIDEVRDHDTGTFCFRAEINPKDSFSFKDNCVIVSTFHSPITPELYHKDYFEEGGNAVIKCSVVHTCPSHPPNLTWSRSGDVINNHFKITEETWKVETILSFTVNQQDHISKIKCKASFYGKQNSEVEFLMVVKGQTNIHHIIIPVISVFGALCLFGVVVFFVVKKYKKQIQELQSRNGNGIWSRISRFSRRNHRKPDTDMRFDTKSNNCVTITGNTGFSKPPFPSPKRSKTGKTGFSKPPFPSPKSKQKHNTSSPDDDDDDYTNLADLNIYGNV